MSQVAAAQYYDFQIQPVDERVLKLDKVNYLVYTNKQLMAEKHCGNLHKTISILEGIQLKIEQGWHIKLNQHQIYGENIFTQTYEDPNPPQPLWAHSR